MPDTLSRWFIVDYQPDGSQHIFTCEIWCHKIASQWHTSATGTDLVTADAHDNIWVSIGNLFNANDCKVIAMSENDRAGNRIVRT